MLFETCMYSCKHRVFHLLFLEYQKTQKTLMIWGSSFTCSEPKIKVVWKQLCSQRRTWHVSDVDEKRCTAGGKKAYFTDIFILCHFLLPNLPWTGKSNGGCSCHKSTSAPVGLQFLLYCFQEPFLLRNGLHNILETPHMVIIDMAY